MRSGGLLPSDRTSGPAPPGCLYALHSIPHTVNEQQRGPCFPLLWKAFTDHARQNWGASPRSRTPLGSTFPEVQADLAPTSGTLRTVTWVLLRHDALHDGLTPPPHPGLGPSAMGLGIVPL